MTTNYVTAEVIPLISENEPLAISIRGGWGTGKTWFWRKKILPEISIQNRKYAYASMFDLNSMADLRREIGYSLQILNPTGKLRKGWDKLRGAEKNDDSFARLIRQGLGDETSFSSYGINANIAVGAAADELMFRRVREAVVCIDDIERRRKDFPIDQILSFINYLVENRRCIVVVLLNFDKLTDIDRNEWLLYSEKVFDRDVSYIPSTEEIANIATPESVDQRWRLSIRERLIRMRVSNIRVAVRARRFAESICRELLAQRPDYGQNITEALIETAIPFSVIHSERGSGAPKLEYFLANKKWESSDHMTEEEKEWNIRMDAYGSLFGDQVDIAIAESVIQGVPLMEKIIEATDTFRAESIGQQHRVRFRSAWRMYHDSFSTNEVDVANAFYSSLKPLIKVETRGNIESSARVLRATGRADLATEILSEWVENSISKNPDDPLTDFLGSPPTDPELISLAEEATKRFKHNPPIDLASAMRDLNSLRDGDMENPTSSIRRISYETPEAIADVLQSDSRDWFPLIERVFSNSNWAPDNLAAAQHKLREALDIVSATSPLNSDRVANKFQRMERPSRR